MLETIKFEVDDLIIKRNIDVNTDSFYGKNQVDANHIQAVYCLRYVIEDILGWDIETAKLKFDSYIINKLNLQPILDYIHFPNEVEPNNPKYILSLLYPFDIHYTNEDMVRDIATKINNNERNQYPRDYFVGGEGFTRFCFCIKFIIEENLTFESVSEIYDFFDYEIKQKKALFTSRLRIPLYQYKIDIYEVIFNLTQDYPDAELWFSYYSFNRAMRKVS